MGASGSLFSAEGERAALLPRLAGWQAELMDFELFAVASEVHDLPTEEARALARARGLNFPLTGRTRTGAPESILLPHTLVYDDQGKRVFRERPLSVKPVVRLGRMSKGVRASLPRHRYHHPSSGQVDDPVFRHLRRPDQRQVRPDGRHLGFVDQAELPRG